MIYLIAMNNNDQLWRKFTSLDKCISYIKKYEILEFCIAHMPIVTYELYELDDDQFELIN